MPLFHTAGCVMAVLGAVVTRGTLILPPYFDPGLMLKLIAAERPDTLAGVPTMLIGMLDHPGFATMDTSSVRRLLTGGAVVPPELVGRVETSFGAPVSIVFAQTEASPVITQTSPQDSVEDRAHTLGRPLPQTQVKIVDPASGQTVAPEMIGELCTRGYHVMTGYFQDPEMTAAAIDADGWLHTGDLASMDERGYCKIAGRLKDMIIRGGENIYPREIEQVLFGHPTVADVAVVGVPDAKWGEQIAAFVCPAPGHTPDPDELSPIAASTWRRTRRRATGQCWTSSRSRHRARCKSSCCGSTSSPRRLTSRSRPKAPTSPPRPHPPRDRHRRGVGRQRRPNSVGSREPVQALVMKRRGRVCC
jgi:fatty-acyl-CoA synthase